MTTVKFTFWPSVVDTGDVAALVTVTRYTDAANNSDKYRRFITMCHATMPSLLPYTFTQTGRWTAMNDVNNWTGGTVRVGKNISAAAFRRAGSLIGPAHDEVVRRGRKDYKIWGATSTPMQWSDLNPLLQRITPNVFDPNGGMAPKPHLTMTAQPVNASSGSPIEIRLNDLLRAASDENVDPFDLFADLAEVKALLAVEEKRVEALQLDFKLANETVLKRATDG